MVFVTACATSDSETKIPRLEFWVTAHAALIEYPAYLPGESRSLDGKGEDVCSTEDSWWLKRVS